MIDKLKQSDPLSVQKVYTLLKGIPKLDELYDSKYKFASLDKKKYSKKNTDTFLDSIQNELKSSKNFTDQLDPTTIETLFALEENDKINSIIFQLRQQQGFLSLDLLCRQLSEFIDLSRLLHFISITSKESFLAGAFEGACLGGQLLTHTSDLKKFAALVSLKFKLFKTNLLDFLQTTEEQSELLEQIANTLLTKFLPELAVATYSTAFQRVGVNPDPAQVKKNIETVEIPSLVTAFEEYMKRISNIKVKEQEGQEEDDDEIYYDAEEDVFYDAENNADIKPSPSLSNEDKDKISCETEDKFVGENPKQHLLVRLWHWIKNFFKKNITKTEKHQATISHLTHQTRCGEASSDTPPHRDSTTQGHSSSDASQDASPANLTMKNRITSFFNSGFSFFATSARLVKDPNCPCQFRQFLGTRF